MVSQEDSEDLFYRINVISILLPLRERKEDIYLLAKHTFPRIREKPESHVLRYRRKF